VEVTIENIEHMLSVRDTRLKTEIASMFDEKLDAKLDAKLAPFQQSLADKATHAEVDAAIAKVIAPVQEQLSELKHMLGELLSKKDASDRDLSRVSGMVEALTNLNSAGVQFVRDRQVETEQQVDVLRVQTAGVAVDLNLLMSDVRGAGKGEGNPSLFDLIHALRDDVKAVSTRVELVQQTHASELAGIRKIVDADHKLIETVRSLGVKSLQHALNASWKAFLKQSVGVQVGAVTVTVLGTLFAGGMAQGWIEPLLIWLLEQMR